VRHMRDSRMILKQSGPTPMCGMAVTSTLGMSRNQRGTGIPSRFALERLSGRGFLRHLLEDLETAVIGCSWAELSNSGGLWLLFGTPARGVCTGRSVCLRS